MSKDLPLWEDDESDVKLEYRLQHGHVLLATDNVDRVVEKVRSVFKLRKPIKISDEAKPEWLPQEQKRKITATVLNDESYWHFILAKFKKNIAIFAPHFLFFNSTKWMKLSRKLKVQLTFVKQGGSNSCYYYYYYVFKNGKHMCNANRDQSGIHQSKMGPMEIYLDGKLIHKADDEKDQFTEDTLKFILEDVLIEVDDEGQVQFKVPLSKDEFRQPTKVKHLMFKARSG